MTIEPQTPNSNFKSEESSAGTAVNSDLNKEIYPPMNEKFKNIVIWLGVAFITIVIWIQNYSGFY